MTSITIPAHTELAERLLELERRHLNNNEAGFLRDLLRFESLTGKQTDQLSKIADKVHGRKSGALPPPLAPPARCRPPAHQGRSALAGPRS
jgi:hypothetical protein